MKNKILILFTLLIMGVGFAQSPRVNKYGTIQKDTPLPTTPKESWLKYDFSTHTFIYHNGTAWVPFGVGSFSLDDVTAVGDTSTRSFFASGANGTTEIASGYFNISGLNNKLFQISHLDNRMSFRGTLGGTNWINLPNFSTSLNNWSFPEATGTFALEADATGFNGNLSNTDNTLQEIAQKFDDFSGGGSSTNPAGSNTEVQFNNSGSFGASSDLIFNDTDNALIFGGLGQIRSYTSHTALEALAGNNLRLTTFGNGNHVGINMGNTPVSSIYLGGNFFDQNGQIRLRGGNAADTSDPTEETVFLQTASGLNIDVLKGEFWLNGGQFLFNIDGGDEDFRVDGVGTNGDNLIRTDANTGRIGFGVSPTAERIHVNGNILSNGYKIPSGTSDDVLLGDGTTTSLASIGGGTNASPMIDIPDNAVRLLAITGQSNASGRALDSDAAASELAVQTNTKIWVAGIVNDWQDLDVGTNNQSTGNQHGIELGLAQKFLTELPNETIYIAKYGLGGSDIDANSPNGAVYNTFNDDYLEPAINQILSTGKIPYIHFYYSQGEADANGADYLLYAEKLQLLIKHYQRKLGKNVHFIFPEILELGANTNESDINDIFNAYQVLEPNVTTIQSKAFSAEDTQHFDYDANKLLAEEVFRSMVYKHGSFVLNDINGYTANNIQYLEGTINYSNATLEEFPESALPSQVTAGERTSGTETNLRSYSPADIKSMAETHASSSGGVSQQLAQFGKEYAWLPYGGGFSTIGTNNPILIGTGSNNSGTFGSNEVQSRWNSRIQSGTEAGARESAPAVTSVGSGFYFQTQFRITPSSSTNVQFYGLSSSNSSLGNVNPSSLTGLFGLAVDDTDTNFHFIYNDDTGAATKLDLGADFARGVYTFQLELYNSIGTTEIQYRVINLETGNDTGFSTITTNLPDIQNGLYPHLYSNIGTGAGSNNLKINYLKINMYQ